MENHDKTVESGEGDGSRGETEVWRRGGTQPRTNPVFTHLGGAPMVWVTAYWEFPCGQGFFHFLLQPGGAMLPPPAATGDFILFFGLRISYSSITRIQEEARYQHTELSQTEHSQMGKQ